MKSVTRKFLIADLVLLILAFASLTFAQNLSEERLYEPVVLKGGTLSLFYDVPIDSISLYAYNEATDTWRMMPFQIDERVKLPDTPFYSDKPRHFYVTENVNPEYAAAMQDTNPAFDDDDELVFMVRDLGDPAPTNKWIDDEESRKHQRLELIVQDPTDRTKTSYGYLYRSSSLFQRPIMGVPSRTRPDYVDHGGVQAFA